MTADVRLVRGTGEAPLSSLAAQVGRACGMWCTSHLVFGRVVRVGSGPALSKVPFQDPGEGLEVRDHGVQGGFGAVACADAHAVSAVSHHAAPQLACFLQRKATSFVSLEKIILTDETHRGGHG